MIGSAGSWSPDHLSVSHSVFMATPSRATNSISQGPFCTIFLGGRGRVLFFFFFSFFSTTSFVSSRAMSSLGNATKRGTKTEIKKDWDEMRKGDETSKYIDWSTVEESTDGRPHMKSEDREIKPKRRIETSIPDTSSLAI